MLLTTPTHSVPTYLAAAYIVQYLNEGTMPPKYFVPFPSELQNPLITAQTSTNT